MVHMFQTAQHLKEQETMLFFLLFGENPLITQNVLHTKLKQAGFDRRLLLLLC